MCAIGFIGWGHVSIPRPYEALNPSLDLFSKAHANAIYIKMSDRGVRK